ncbi:MAG: gliding motility lipoprotein GldH [Janthinobacterium lividum]
MIRFFDLRFLAQPRALVGALGLLVLAGCDPDRVFEENTDFPNNSWDVQRKPAFSFAIADTAARYNVYFDVRNASVYPFYNLYVKATLTGPSGRVGAPLLHQMLLMDPKTGEPRGSGTGDIYDHQILALPRQRFAQPGNYTLTLEQFMRQDQLPGLMAVGVRVAKYQAPAKK